MIIPSLSEYSFIILWNGINILPDIYWNCVIVIVRSFNYHVFVIQHGILEVHRYGAWALEVSHAMRMFYTTTFYYWAFRVCYEASENECRVFIFLGMTAQHHDEVEIIGYWENSQLSGY